MNSLKPMFVREVARIDDPPVRVGTSRRTSRAPFDRRTGRRVRRSLRPDGRGLDAQGIFAFHPHRGIETVTFVIEGAIEHRDSAGYRRVRAGDVDDVTAMYSRHRQSSNFKRARWIRR